MADGRHLCSVVWPLASETDTNFMLIEKTEIGIIYKKPLVQTTDTATIYDGRVIRKFSWNLLKQTVISQQ